MLSPELYEYIRQASAAGAHPEEIQQNLRTAGWAEEDIQAAFMPQGAHAAQPHSGLKTALIIFAISISVFAIIVLAMFFIFKKSIDIVENRPVNYNSSLANSTTKDHQRYAQMRQIETSLELFFNLDKTYPATLAELENSPVNKANIIDPATQQPYYYQQRDQGKNYQLCYSDGVDTERCITTEHTVRQ